MDPDDEDVELYSADLDKLDVLLGVKPAGGGEGPPSAPSDPNQFSLKKVKIHPNTLVVLPSALLC